MDEHNTGNGLMVLPADIDERVSRNLRVLFENQDAFSENTMSQMLSVIRCWARWCEARNKTWLPGAPDDVREYLLYLKNDLGRAVSTVNQHQAMINKVHKHAGLQRPSDDMSVSLGMKAIRRRAMHAGEKVSQAIPLHVEDVFRLADVWEDSDKLSERRDLAFIGVAYSSLLRISNVARLRVQDLVFRPDGSAIFDVGYTKTIDEPNSIAKVLPPEVAGWVRGWILMSCLSDKPESMLFSKVDRYNNAHPGSEPMKRVNIEKLFARAWLALDLPHQAGQRYRTWTGHSPRVGAAQDMAMRGKTLVEIMHEGTWKRPEQVLSYIRNIEADKSVMLDLIKGVKRKK
ncbi:TPA: tyrosine-type recombinase/integrase [Enterobacter hormaechei subsp. xiangfangensis]